MPALGVLDAFVPLPALGDVLLMVWLLGLQDIALWR